MDKEVTDLGISYERLLVYHKTFMKSISFSEISICHLEDRVTRIITKEGEIFCTPRTMNELELRLPSDDFFRISRNCIIAYKSILKVEPYFGNRLVIFPNCTFQKKLSVSRPRVPAFKNWLGE